MKRATTVIGSAILIAAGGISAAVYSYVSPAIALDDIRAAAKHNDKERLRELIDFESVKTGLKEDVKAMMLVSAGESLKNNPFAALGLAMVTMMVDPIVESIVSPSGLAALMAKGGSEQAPPVASIPSVASIQGTHTTDGVDIEKGYQGFSKYRIRIREAGSSDEALVLSLRREGIFSWKLASVSLPANLIANLQQGKNDAIASHPGQTAVPRPSAEGVAQPRDEADSSANQPTKYVIPVGAFSNADAVIARLAEAKLPFFTEPATTAKGTYIRVRVGPFADKESADNAVEMLKGLGFKAGNVYGMPVPPPALARQQQPARSMTAVK